MNLIRIPCGSAEARQSFKPASITLIGAIKGQEITTSGSHMPVVARCPSCGSSLSETSVIALAPACMHCGSVLTSVGGTLGLTSAYGVSDQSISRRRVEADLAVIVEYKHRYHGMLEVCKQQLQWGADRYATLPPSPDLLEVQPVPDLMDGIGWNIALTIFPWFYIGIPGAVVSWILSLIWKDSAEFSYAIVGGICALLSAAVIWETVSPYVKAVRANGERPAENRRRQMAYEAAVANAVKVAAPLKAAEDHRLRVRIRELEGLIKTMSDKENEIRDLLRAL